MIRHPMLVLVPVLVVACSGAADAQPSVDQFKQALEAQIQKLKPTGFTDRTVLFQDVNCDPWR